MGISTAPHNVRRRASRAVAAVCASCLLMPAAGTPAVAQDPVLSVDSVRLYNAPADGLHPLGSVVRVRVGFNQGPVVVTGQPRVALTIGTKTRYAGFWRTSTSGQSMYFTYVVQASDRDDDGISIPANALTLNGGSIRDGDGNDAGLSHDAVPDNPEHRVDGAHDPPPTIERVRVYSLPLSGDTFGADEEIRAQVTFSKPVTVTGNPRLVLRIGDQTRGADLFGVSGEHIYFRHFVEASDLDDDGVGIPANAVLLNRGSIRDSRGQDAELTHEAVPDDPERKVNGRLGLDAVPSITRVFLSSRPLQGDTFVRGQSFLVGVQFSEPVRVSGTPQLAIQLGTQTHQAELHIWQRSILYFEHVVQPSDVDTDGISVPADALTLNGGSIRDADGNDADLTHDAVPDDPERKVNGASGPPAVQRVYFSRLPGSQDTFVAGESVFVVVRFTRGVQVTGTPRFTLQVGAQARRAEHLPRLRAAELVLQGNSFHSPGEDEHNVYFRYVVQPSDLDDDGVSAPADALALDGGAIRAVDDGSDARLSHGGLDDDPRRRVDGSRSDEQAPAVANFRLDPPVRGVFGGGDTITVQLGWNEGVTVTGAPRFALRIGAHTRFATFRERWGTTSLLFDYVVDESDRDDNGLSVDADAVDLNGGTIRDNGGNDADLDLGYRAFNDDPNYRVNGGLTPVPALPLGGALALLFVLLGGGWRRLARQSERRR